MANTEIKFDDDIIAEQMRYAELIGYNEIFNHYFRIDNFNLVEFNIEWIKKKRYEKNLQYRKGNWLKVIKQ